MLYSAELSYLEAIMVELIGNFNISKKNLNKKNPVFWQMFHLWFKSHKMF